MNCSLSPSLDWFFLIVELSTPTFPLNHPQTTPPMPPLSHINYSLFIRLTAFGFGAYLQTILSNPSLIVFLKVLFPRFRVALSFEDEVSTNLTSLYTKPALELLVM